MNHPLRQDDDPSFFDHQTRPGPSPTDLHAGAGSTPRSGSVIAQASDEFLEGMLEEIPRRNSSEQLSYQRDDIFPGRGKAPDPFEDPDFAGQN